MYAFYEYLFSEAKGVERDSVTRHWHQDFFVYQLPRAPSPDYRIIIFQILINLRTYSLTNSVHNATLHGNKWEKFPNRKLFCIFCLNTFD